MIDETIGRVVYGEMIAASGNTPEVNIKVKLANRIADTAWIAIGKLMGEKDCWGIVHDKGLDVVEFGIKLSIECGYSLFPYGEEISEEDEDG